ncbi:MAG: 5'-nucleotidase [Bacteroidota bacterium]|nr:5'-nucleotidase [Bacteroidota bacterium]
MRKFINAGLLACALMVLGCGQTKLVQLRATHIPVDQNADAIQDQVMVSAVKPYADIAVKTADEAIGYTDQDLTPGRPESLLGNFFADVMLSYAQKHSTGRVDFAVTNPGGLRKPIHKGDIKVAHIYELMPFENALVVLDLKGDRVQALADSVAAHHGGPVAGIRFGIKNRKAVNVAIAGEPLDVSKTYRVVANDYIAKGNDFYQELTKASSAEFFTVSLRSVILNWVKQETAKGNHIHATLDRRIYEDKE